MFYLNKYYLYYTYFINNFLISKLNVLNNFDIKIKYLEIFFNYKSLNKRNWILNLHILVFLIMGSRITYKKQKMFSSKTKKINKRSSLYLIMRLQKKKLLYALQNFVFFLFSFGGDTNLLTIKRYIKYKALNDFNFILIPDLMSYPYIKKIFKYESEYFYMKYNFQLYFKFIFKNNIVKNNFYNNLNLLKILKFPIQRNVLIKK